MGNGPTQTPPGWYDDGRGSMRYWDGANWTEHSRSEQPAQSPQAAQWAPAMHAAAPKPRRSRGKTLLTVGGAGVAALFVMAGIGSALNGSGSSTTAGTSPTTTSAPTTSPTVEQPAPTSTTSTTTKSAPAKTTPASKPTKTTPPPPKLTVSQEQAVLKAQDYLEYQAFSRKGLIDQLKFEGFGTKDATFAVDHISVNWNQQAAKKAKEYLSTQPFSRSSLIQQLEFEGFTAKQARYGVSKTGL